jgi:hypothetical protein
MDSARVAAANDCRATVVYPPKDSARGGERRAKSVRHFPKNLLKNNERFDCLIFCKPLIQFQKKESWH